MLRYNKKSIEYQSYLFNVLNKIALEKQKKQM